MWIQQFKKALAVSKKDIRIYYLKHPVIIHGILFPLFLFLAFYIRRNLSLDFILPGMVGMTLFFTTTAIVSIIPSWEARSRTLERLVSTPISISAIILGDILASFLFGIAISVVPIIIGIFGGVSIYSPLIIILGILLASFCFSAFGCLLSVSSTDLPANVMMLSTLIKFPLIFISGIFIPIKQLPLWGKILASVSPLTYFTDLARYCIQQDNYYPIGIDFLILFVFALVFFVLAIKLHERGIPRRI